jgi:Na+-translocating ferredoxin:NAD+ oxidoreductase subunit B
MRSAKPLSDSEREALIQTIDAVLPQTQCTRCEYPACRPYAEAVAKQETPINRCEPGGEAVIAEIARQMKQFPMPLFHPPRPTQVAWIREEDCIGCARCLPTCPVDAILGARRWMHTVITEDCTGCDLCLKSCPVDCIEMVAPPEDWSLPDPALSRQRYLAHRSRQAFRRTQRLQLQDRAERRAAMIAKARAEMENRRKKSHESN